MKNVHLITTDKPSRLVKFFTNKFHLCKEILPIEDEEQYQNIYITSDEEIKTGDYILELKDNSVWTIQIQTNTDLSKYKKITLTTDQDLINDGIQSIDDEFLEWFVKNPKCEEIVVEREKAVGYTEDRQRTFYGKYKIIIPKEEPKQETSAQTEISDEEIEKIAKEYVLYNESKRNWVVEGMKLYREQFKKKQSGE